MGPRHVDPDRCTGRWVLDLTVYGREVLVCDSCGAKAEASAENWLRADWENRLGEIALAVTNHEVARQIRERGRRRRTRR